MKLEIQQKLEALAIDETNILPVSSRQSINRILNELKDQERINEAALEILKKRILKDSLAKSPTRNSFMSNSNQNLYPKRSPFVSNSFSKPIVSSYPVMTPQFHTPSASSYLSKPYSMLDDSLSHEEIRFVM